MYRFRATIEKGAFGQNSWCFVKVPDDVALALGGARRVTGTIASRAFDGALQTRGAGVKSVLVTRELRDALGLEPGHEIEVELQADARPRSVSIPDELATALENDPVVAAQFAALARSHQREYADWVAQAKKPETKAKRVDRALEMIAEKQRVK